MLAQNVLTIIYNVKLLHDYYKEARMGRVKIMITESENNHVIDSKMGNDYPL